MLLRDTFFYHVRLELLNIWYRLIGAHYCVIRLTGQVSCSWFMDCDDLVSGDHDRLFRRKTLIPWMLSGPPSRCLPGRRPTVHPRDLVAKVSTEFLMVSFLHRIRYECLDCSTSAVKAIGVFVRAKILEQNLLIHDLVCVESALSHEAEVSALARRILATTVCDIVSSDKHQYFIALGQALNTRQSPTLHVDCHGMLRAASTVHIGRRSRTLAFAV
ncbi:hypothetical protein FVE85_2107 [Porphyridium purpureum]|uniref:Uncharacterized protein n=1 Tax=Porphyridium purpureum TaxID=35688 RepID=A0A5J4YYJ2_PORPP|nr:hypothetical protein FVE85_2107 [Porphyridium purpureum]|eukprot:POR5537..scf209_3